MGLKISGLTAVGAFADAHEYIVNDAGNSKKITGAQIRAALPQGTLPGGYAQVVANQTGITTLVDLTGLTVTVTFAASRRIKISAGIFLNSSVAGDVGRLDIDEGATALQSDIKYLGTTGAFGLAAMVVLMPSAGAHTYKLQAGRVSGTGTLVMNAAPTIPAYILVEDIGV